MAPRLRQMIKTFGLQESDRSGMVLDQGVRLNPKLSRLEIMPIGGALGTKLPKNTPDLLARTRVTGPSSLKQWTGFFVLLTQPKGTTILFRLGDGVKDYYWSAGANQWIVASPGNWSSEKDVANNIDKWGARQVPVVGGLALQVVVNLATTDEKITPVVDEIRLSYDCDLEFLEDYVVRSFIADLREQLRPIGRIEQASDGSTVTFDLSKIQTPYDVVGLDSVYDATADPDQLSDLGATFDPVTKIVTLPGPVPSGNKIHIRFLWRPEVVVSKSQDYTELAKIPVVIFDDVNVLSELPIRNRPFILNKGTNQGFAFEEAFQADISIPFSFITDKGFDLHSLQGELRRYFANNKRLRSRGQDEFFDLRVSQPFDAATTTSQKELHTGRLLVTIVNAVFYPEDAKQITGVKRFSVTGGNLTFEVSAT